ncbi:hypothetical protein CL622_08205 [archaeon]|nr:hypothetical protein [archaeon]
MKLEKLNEWNPWWEKPDLIKAFEGKERTHYQDIIDSIQIREIIIITGIRRSGKSTLMYQMISKLLDKGTKPEQILFINFEDPKLRNDSLEDLYQAYKEELNPNKKTYIFFDEIHKKKGWEAWIRKQYDLKKDLKFVISGSSSQLLKKEYSTLLTGRNLTFEIFPLSFSELLRFKNINYDKTKLSKGIIQDKTKHKIVNTLSHYIKKGGFPEIILKPERYKLQLLEQYFSDILYKDIIDRYNVHPQKTKDLLLFLLTNMTGIISLRNIRNALGLSYDTIKEYVTYAKEAFLFFTVDHFSYSLKEQKTLPSKVYCIDTGLRNAVSLTFSKDTGKLVENIVLIALKRKWDDVYYWKKTSEVDFIVKAPNQTLTAINVTYTNQIKNREIDGLKEFKVAFPKRITKLILITKDLETVKDDIAYIPLWKWLLTEKMNQ